MCAINCASNEILNGLSRPEMKKKLSSHSILCFLCNFSIEADLFPFNGRNSGLLREVVFEAVKLKTKCWLELISGYMQTCAPDNGIRIIRQFPMTAVSSESWAVVNFPCVFSFPWKELARISTAIYGERFHNRKPEICQDVNFPARLTGETNFPRFVTDRLKQSAYERHRGTGWDWLFPLAAWHDVN